VYDGDTMDLEITKKILVGIGEVLKIKMDTEK